MKFRCLFFVFALSTQVSAQHWSLKNSLNLFFQKYEPEFVELHTDASVYKQRDNIWFKVYVVNPARVMLGSSMVVYVELMDANKQALIRHKVLCEDGYGWANMEIPRSLPSSTYSLRAYTLWMKNFSEARFASVPIYIGEPETAPHFPIGVPVENPVSVRRTEDSLAVLIDSPLNGSIVIYQYGNVLLEKKIEQKEIKIYTKGTVDEYQPISIALFDENMQLVRSISSAGKEGNIKIRTNKQNYAARERVVMTLSPEGSIGDFVQASVTVSAKTHALPPNIPTRDVPMDVILKKNDVVSMKEVIVYPRQSNSLSAIEYKEDKAAYASATSVQSLITKSYGLDALRPEKTGLTVPSDNTYVPTNFVQLPTLESLLREVVPQVRILNKKSVKSIQLRNIENSQKVFFYKKNPLLLVDNRIFENIDEFLAINPSDIQQIDVTWRSETINKSGVYGLADNGILSVKTISNKPNPELTDLYKEFAIPSRYPAKSYEKKTSKDVIPDFRTTVYWEPALEISGKRELSFYLSDESGEYVVDVIGYDSQGRRVSGQARFVVD
jgi:hypothetical protein